MKTVFKTIIVLLIFPGCMLLHAQRENDSLLGLLRQSGEDSNKVKLMIQLCSRYTAVGQYDTAVKYAENIFALSSRINYEAGKGASLSLSGNILLPQGKLTEAETNYRAALEIYTRLKMKKNIGNTYSNLGNIYVYQDNYSKALQNYLVALKMREEIKDNHGQAISHINIGVVYYNLKNYKKAMEHYRQSKTMFESEGNKASAAACLQNMGNIHFIEGDYESALSDFNEAMPIFISGDDKLQIANGYANIANVYVEQNKLEAALQNIQAAMKIREVINDKGGLSACYNNMAAIFILQKKFAKAKEYAEKSLALNATVHSLDGVRQSYLHLTQIDSATGDFKSSYKNYKLYISYGDSLFNEENTKKQTQLEMQYDFDKKSAADSIKNAEAKKFEEVKHQHEISKQKTFTYGGIIGFLVMIVVAGISYNAFRNKKKANLEIQHQKELVEEKQKEILDSITYARRIQRSLLTSEKYFTKNLNRLSKS